MNKQFKLLALCTSLFTGITAFHSPVMAQTLVQAVEQTIQSNPEILAEANRRLSVDKTIDQARAGYAPRVDLNLGYGREYTKNPATRPGSESLTRGEASITARQMLYDGFYTKSEVDRTTASADSAGFAVTDISERRSLQAIGAYLDVLRRQDLLKLTQTNLESHQTIFSQIEQRSESGVGRRADVDQAQARLALSQSNLESQIGNVEDARTNFQRVVGTMPENITNPGDGCCDQAPATLDDAVKIAYNQHPTLRTALANHEASLAQENAAKSAFHPRVDLDLGASANNNLDGEPGHDKGLYAMFRLQYNLLNGGADKARIEQIEHLSEQQKELINRAQREIELDVRLAWNALENAERRLPGLKQRVEAAEKTREAYAAQFRIGQRTLLDLLDSENELLSSGIAYTEAYYDRIYACYWLMQSMGKLLETMAIEQREEALTVASQNNEATQ
ncbi:type I secretion protein TolC [Methylophaga sp. SB9B]|uniref:TolC family outer membrane protein n=1 Tax=Methylophaga sp. SB9B TaxID=2570356 RepID=UPI0010A8A32B|nr:TolC family outer membrane protein [Methylophaga sp. SB9B]THK40803.1 type I secretion protein TolC [Methylophaga sp. SB9B]